MAVLFGFFWALAYWVTNKALGQLEGFSFQQKAKLAAIIPASMYSPLFFFQLLEGYAFFLYLITLPAGMYFTKAIINNELFTFAHIRSIYWAIFLRILGTMAILGLIARTLKFLIKN